MIAGLVCHGGLFFAVMEGSALIQGSEGVIAVLLAVPAVTLMLASHRTIGRPFKIVPPLVLCYFVPTALSTAHVIPSHGEVYDWVKDFVLPACLVLLTLSLDLPAIARLGPKAVVMFLAGTAGVVIGGPIALAIWRSKLPADACQALTYLAGSWIGGSANGIALQKMCGVSSALIGPLIVVDAAFANLWLGMLLFLAGRRTTVDRWLGAKADALEALGRCATAMQRQVEPVVSVNGLLAVLAVGFGAAWLADLAGRALLNARWLDWASAFLGAFGWKVVLVTTVGVLLSLTPARKLEAAGASRVGTVMIYVMVACIGAEADLAALLKSGAGYYLALGATWLLIHGLVLVIVGRLLRAPYFYLAVGSQANIGGAASTPIVAAAFHPALAPVGVILAVAGYALATYAGLCCIYLCRLVAGQP